MSVFEDNRTDRIVTSSKYSELAATARFLETELKQVGSEISHCLNAKVGGRPVSRAAQSPRLCHCFRDPRFPLAELICRSRQFGI
jgi:hypothetical protein